MKIKNILVSQPKPTIDKSPYFDIAKRYNVKIDFRPFVKVEGISAKEFRRSKVNITDFTSMIFSSKNAIDHFYRMCEELRISIDDNWKYFCLTESIALYLQKYVTYRKRKIFYGNGKFEDMIDYVTKFSNENFLIPLSSVHKEDIPNKLKELKIKYSKAILYQTVASDLSDMGDLNSDLIVFFSPAGVQSLFQNFPDFEQGKTCIGAFGPLTAKEVESHNLRLDVKAPVPGHLSMTSSIEHFIKERNK